MIVVEAVADLRAFPGDTAPDYARRARHRLDGSHQADLVRIRVNRAAIGYAALIAPALPATPVLITAERGDIAARFAAQLKANP